MEDKIQAVIDPVIAGMDLLAEGKEWDKADARAADSAALSAAASADGWAANVAARAARAAAWEAVRRRQRDLLLKLIKEAPVVAVEGE